MKTMILAFFSGVFVLLCAMNCTNCSFHICSSACGVAIVCKIDLMSVHSFPVSLCCSFRTFVSTALFLYSSAVNHQHLFLSSPGCMIGFIWNWSPVMMY